jgi:hypothetical protein
MSIHGAGGAEDDHRCSVTPRVENRHARMHQPDVGVQCHGHGLLRHLAVAVGNRDRMLFVQADDHLRIAVAQIVDDAVVKATIAGAGHQSDVLQIEPSGYLCNDVAPPLHLWLTQILRAIDLGAGWLPIFCLRNFPGYGCFHWIPLSPKTFWSGSSCRAVKQPPATVLNRHENPSREAKTMRFSFSESRRD